MVDSAESLMSAGRGALENGDWAGARDAFGAVVDRAPGPTSAEALFGLAEALWWLGDVDASIGYRERSFAAFCRRPDPMQAALAAIVLCFDYRKQIGNTAASAGWLARATRLVEDNQVDDLRGWLAFARSFDSEDLDESERRAHEARSWAQNTGDHDLELCALSQIGAVLVKRGRVAEGVGRLDEALAGALGGEGSRPDTVVFASCMMITSCADCAEFERAVQWVRETRRFADRYGCPFLFAECRIVYGAVLLATGDWAQADEELRAVLQQSVRTVPSLYRRAAATLAELRLAQGRIGEAERLVVGLDDHPETAAVMARLHLIHRRPVAAASTVQRRLDVIGRQQLESAELVELLGESSLARDDPESAGACGRELADLGGTVGCEVIRARGQRLLGRALLAADDVTGARRHLDAALVAFARLEMRYQAARTRAFLAGPLREIEPEVSAAEARAALAVFEQLGAADADAAAALLRDMGVKAARIGPRELGQLTKREREVLVLVRDGLSNPEIASRLYLSRRTVEHHVASVLAKLGVRTRAEAARCLDGT